MYSSLGLGRRPGKNPTGREFISRLKESSNGGNAVDGEEKSHRRIAKTHSAEGGIMEVASKYTRRGEKTKGVRVYVRER